MAPILVSIGVILIPLAVASGVASYLSVYRESVHSMQQQNKALVNQIDGWINLKKNLIDHSAMLLRTLDLSSEMAIEYFAAIAEDNRDVSDVRIGFPDGSAIAAAGGDPTGSLRAHDTQWYAAAAQAPGTAVFTVPQVDVDLERLSFSVARTIGNHDDSLGVLDIEVLLTTMIAYVEEANEADYGSSFILDIGGYILLHPDPAFGPLDYFTFQNKAQVEGGRYAEIFAALMRDGFYSGGGVIYVGVPLETTGWYVISRVPTSYILGKVFWPLFSIIATGLLAAIALIGAGLLFRKIRASEKRERDASELNEILLNISPFMVNIWDDNYDLVATSDRTAKMFGLAGQKQYIERFSELSPEYQPCGTTSREKARNCVKQAFEGGYAKFEWMHQTVSGEPLPSEITLVRFSRHGRYMVAAYANDLRELKAAQEREREANELNEIFFNVSPFVMNIWDDDYALLATSRQSVEMFGLASQKQYIERFFELSPEYQPCGAPSRVKAIDCVKEAFREGSSKFEWMHQTVSGEPLPTEITLVRFERKGKYMLAAYTVDLRPMKAVQAREQEANEMARMLLETSPLLIEIWDEDLNVIDCNQRTLDVFGFSAKEEFLSRYYDFIPEFQPGGEPSLKMRRKCAEKTLREGSVLYEWAYQKPDGEHLPLEVTCVRIDRDGKPMIVAYSHDLRLIEAAMQGEREANEMARMFLDASPMFIKIWDEDLNLVDCNEQTCEVFGVTSREAYIDRHDKFMPEFQPCGTPSREKALFFLEEAKRNALIRFEFMYLTAHGEMLPVETTIAHLKLHGKYMLVGYNHDLRPIKQAAEKIREAEKRVQLMLNATPMSICLYDTTLTPVDCNQEAVRMFGVPDKASFLDKKAFFVPPIQPDGSDSKDVLESMLMQAFKEGWARAEYICEKADGTPVPAEITFVRVEYQGGYAVVEYTRDLTQIRAAMEKEREAEERVKLVLDASPLACYLLDTSREALDCNQAAIELFAKQQGKPLAETYPGHEDFEKCKVNCEECRHRGRGTCRTRKYIIYKYNYIFPGFEQNKEQVKRWMSECYDKAQEEGIFRLEISAVALYGEHIPCEVTIVPVKYQDGGGFAVYLRDLRESKRMQEEMQLREVAEEESKAKTRFLARMSHEIRTPMNAVMGIAEIQLQKESHPPETEDAFLRIYSSSKILLTIINDILDLSKVEAGKMEIMPTTYEVANLIEDTIQLNLMNIGSRKVDFILTLDENLPAYLIGDALRIKQVLSNLLSNAFKYTKEGMVTLSIGLGDPPAEGKALLVLRVQDTGQGMTKKQIDHLFDVFTRFNLHKNREIEGSGLGMSIAYSFITMMNGEIKVDSTPKKGSTFTVCLPQKIKGSELLGRETIESLQKLEITRKPLKKVNKFTLEPMPYGRVLVVDDVDINLYVAEGILASYEIAVETAESGPEAIKKIRSGEKYDIVFMDHMMPGMDGIEATKIMREMGYDRPIIALTANAVKDSADMFMGNGFTGFISKPIDIDKLNVYLARFIRDKHPSQHAVS